MASDAEGAKTLCWYQNHSAQRWYQMDLDSFLVSLYVLVDDWWHEHHPPAPRKKTGRPVLLSESEVLTLAILAQWPRFRSERDFWRFARAHLRNYFPTLCSQSQFNRRVRALQPELRSLQHDISKTLCDGSEAYRVLDTTLIPAIVRVRARRRGLFAGQATFGRCRSKTEWIYGFKVALAVSPEGIITTFGLAPAACDERPIGEAIIASERHDAYLADKGFSSVGWERHWLESYGVLVAATPKNNSRRAWSEGDRCWASGKRQIIEGVIDQLKDLFALERHRAKTLSGLLTRLAAKIAAYTCGQCLNDSLGRPLRHLADLLV
jgi:Transposase DDE domain